ncbi:MAG: BMP family ABC transporter substrate-binding protein [Oscillospiraceae bacterium]|nr:BMP family ABC transporter substrate-binding protein [Oscillospiraceae bacterium]
MKKSTKKLMALVLACLLTVAFSMTGCSSKDTSSGSSTASKEKIALVCSAAGANDNGYNQAAIKGLNQLKTEKGVDTKVVETTTDYPGTLKTLADAGYKLIYSLEYDFTALIDGVGGEKPLAEQYPDTTFVVFNANPNLKEDNTAKFKNVISVMFNVNEASFLAGALSVKVNENASVLFDSSKYSLTTGDAGRAVGFIGGTQSSGIEVFSYGYAEGINYVAKELGVNYTYYSTYNAGFSDSATGGTTAGTYYSEGANVVYTVAGSVGDGVDAKAKEVKKLSIEVDANKDSAQPGYILTSVLKNTNVPVYALGTALIDGTLASKGGTVINYSLGSEATGITDLSTIAAAIKSDSAAQAKWTEIKNYITDLSSKIGSGTIKVTNAQIGETLDIATLSNVKLPK